MHPYALSKPNFSLDTELVRIPEPAVAPRLRPSSCAATQTSYLNIEEPRPATYRVPRSSIVLFFGFLPLPSVLAILYACTGQAILRFGNTVAVGELVQGAAGKKQSSITVSSYDRISLASTAAAAATGGIVLAFPIALFLAFRISISISNPKSLPASRPSSVSKKPDSVSRHYFPPRPPTPQAPAASTSNAPHPQQIPSPSPRSSYSNLTEKPQRTKQQEDDSNAPAGRTTTTASKATVGFNRHDNPRSVFGNDNHSLSEQAPTRTRQLQKQKQPKTLLYTILIILSTLILGTISTPLGIACLNSSSSSSNNNNNNFLSIAEAAIASLTGIAVLNLSLAMPCLSAWIGWRFGFRNARRNERETIGYIARSLETQY